MCYCAHFVPLRLDADGWSVNFTHRRHLWERATASADLEAYCKVAVARLKKRSMEQVASWTSPSSREHFLNIYKCERLYRIEDAVRSMRMCRNVRDISAGCRGLARWREVEHIHGRARVWSGATRAHVIQSFCTRMTLDFVTARGTEHLMQ